MNVMRSAPARRKEICVGESFGMRHSRNSYAKFVRQTGLGMVATALALALSSTMLLEPRVDVASTHAPQPKKLVVLARTRRQSVAMPRQARLWMPQLEQSEKLNLIERMGDGSLSQASYFDISLDLKRDTTDSASLEVQTGQQDIHPFDLVLNDAMDAHNRAHISGLGYASDQVKPLNMSVAPPVGTALAVKRLVTLPVREERLRDIKGAMGVSEQEFANLASGLGSDLVRKGEELDLITGQYPSHPHATEILFARHVSAEGHERILARCDDGHFQIVADRRPYDRMVAEALALEAKEVRVLIAEGLPKDVSALQDAAADYPKLVQHLMQKKVPAKVSLQIIQLLRTNGIRWSQKDDLPQLDFVFRKTEQGEQELVSVTLKGSNGRDRHFYRYVSDSGKPEFFDDAGRSASKPLMHKPVAAGKLGDGFGWRVHPILRTRKFHNGVDYRAPMGSPIVAAGDGVVVKISSETGYGKYIRIQHEGGYTTTYAHIEDTPKGLGVGDHVGQGQVIAYVGSTGLSTGPHLYYELRVGDTYKDPTKAQIPAGTTLRGRALDEFRQQMDRVETIAHTIKASTTTAAQSVSSALSSASGQ